MAQKFCIYCGAELKPDLKFCPKCGEPIRQENVDVDDREESSDEKPKRPLTVLDIIFSVAPVLLWIISFILLITLPYMAKVRGINMLVEFKFFESFETKNRDISGPAISSFVMLIIQIVLILIHLAVVLLRVSKWIRIGVAGVSVVLAIPLMVIGFAHTYSSGFLFLAIFEILIVVIIAVGIVFLLVKKDKSLESKEVVE